MTHFPNSPFAPARPGTWPLQGHHLDQIKTIEEAFDLGRFADEPFEYDQFGNVRRPAPRLDRGRMTQ